MIGVDSEAGFTGTDGMGSWTGANTGVGDMVQMFKDVEDLLAGSGISLTETD